MERTHADFICKGENKIIFKKTEAWFASLKVKKKKKKKKRLENPYLGLILSADCRVYRYQDSTWKKS